MVPEARIEHTDDGRVPQGEGWYIVNARDAQWGHTPEMGSYVHFEGDARFQEFGINIQVLEPGQPNCMYHAEEGQEDFLVLSGECLLLVEGQERRLKAWDFFHAAPMTEHVFVGAGDGPCAILMVGSRKDGKLIYPVSEVALRHGAGVEKETASGKEAYAAYDAPTPGRMRPGHLPD
jgi:uncharacterized cupin superfamily protein